MTYRALFIGGPIDGQERVLQVAWQNIVVSDRQPTPTTPRRTVTYHWVHDFETPEGLVLVYSLWDAATTLLHLWAHYTEHRYSVIL
jgi:hypothetical protein